MDLRALALLFLIPVPAAAADPVVPLTVCEVLTNLPAHEGKEVAVLGRYSFRKDGRWIGEQACDPAAPSPPLLWLTEDSVTAPRPPGNFELDATTLNRKFVELLKHTALGKFRFGTPDYDRWAVVYGRVVPRKADDSKKAPADLIFRGSGVIIFLTTDR
jgi:hypothetical protein